jgi:serine phosphatase RsbU (regulator of sigma subunit)
MIVPMRIGDDTLGAITFVSADSGRTFDDDDFAFAQDLALRAATAVQNARLYEEQARVAHTLQASLLPDRLPEVPGWLGAASYQAGEQGADVGGDFYDIVPATGDRHLVFLGDVTGKGIAAAALTSLVRHSVRTAARFDSRPGAVLALVNEILVEQPRLAPVTLVCALVDGPRVTVAAGGHPPPLLRRGGAVTELGARGVLLGAIGGQAYPEVTVTVAAGDTLLLYTDGVTDTPGSGERFGHERLSAILDAAPGEPDAVLDRIEAALREFQFGTAVDDRAMLVLRFTGAADELPAAA